MERYDSAWRCGDSRTRWFVGARGRATAIKLANSGLARFRKRFVQQGVLPLTLEDRDLEGGVNLLERLKIFVPHGIARSRGQGDALTWGDAVLLWNGDPLAMGRRRWHVDPG